MEIKEGSQEELKTQNVCRRLVIGAIGELMIAEIDKLSVEDPLWKQNVKRFGNKFLKELEKDK